LFQGNVSPSSQSVEQKIDYLEQQGYSNRAFCAVMLAIQKGDVDAALLDLKFFYKT
jgi:hypothetical protein